MRINRIIALLIMLLPVTSFAQTGTAKIKSVLSAEISSCFPDQTTGAITPAIMRACLQDFLASWQQFPAVNAQTGITYTFAAGDYGALVTFNNTNPVAVSLPTPTGNFGIGWNVFVRNTNSGVVTITPVGALINGLASITATNSQSMWIVSDGTNYQVWNNTNGTLTNINMSVPSSIFSVTETSCVSSCAISITVAGISGGMPFFDSASTLSSSNALTQFGVLYGGGPGGSPASSASAVTGTVLRGGSSGAPSFTPTPILGTSATTGGSLGFANGTSGITTISPSTGGLGNSILTLPVATDTLIGKATTDTLTNKTFDTAGAGNVFKINGTQVSTVTGSGSVNVMQSAPTLLSPILGNATATTINNLSISSATGTLAIVAGKTLTANNSITFAGADSTTMTFPASSASMAALTLPDQGLVGGVSVTALGLVTGNIQPDCGARPSQTVTNNGAFQITAPTGDGYCLLKVTNGVSASSITFSGFSVGSNTGDALSTVNGFKYIISIIRITGDSTYSVKSLQ